MGEGLMLLIVFGTLFYLMFSVLGYVWAFVKPAYFSGREDMRVKTQTQAVRALIPGYWVFYQAYRKGIIYYNSLEKEEEE